MDIFFFYGFKLFFLSNDWQKPLSASKSKAGFWKFGEKNEWSRNTRFLLQRSSTPWICCSFCFQGLNLLTKLNTPFISFISHLFSTNSLAHNFLLLVAKQFKNQLLQIQKKHKLIAPGSSVLDLGCAPGAWLQVSSLSF